MSCYSKEKAERNDFNNICKSHSARSDRELYRICPSKLSKRELEDLYFSLLENNLNLKRTINGQEDKIKGLSAKVQRMTAAQKCLQSKEIKECCSGTKSIVAEQRESITELKHINEKMAEKIKNLNMKLCSAKQFFKKSPQLTTPRCVRCASNAAATNGQKRNSFVESKPNVPNEPVHKCTTSSQYTDRDGISMKSAQTDTRELERQVNDDQMSCDENRCRSLMEDLKLKIINLQEELSHVHEEYSNRIGRLESEVSNVRKENVRVNSERRASEHELITAVQKNSELLATYRSTEAKSAELATQLSIEKRKVAQLETQLRAASISDRVNKTIEDHLITIKDPNVSPQSRSAKGQKYSNNDCACPPESPEKAINKPAKPSTCACPRSGEESPGDTAKPAKKSFFSRVGSHKTGSKISKSSRCKTSCKTSNASDPKALDCNCLSEAKSKPAHSTPTKRDSKIVRSTACECSVTTHPWGTQPQDLTECRCPPWEDPSLINKLTTAYESITTTCFNCGRTPQTQPERDRTDALPPGGVNIDRLSPQAYNDDSKTSKPSEDSGYIDANRSPETDEGLRKMNKELIRKILELQSQVDSMKITGGSELPANKPSSLSENYAATYSGTTTGSSYLSPTGKEEKKTEPTYENFDAYKFYPSPGRSRSPEEQTPNKAEALSQQVPTFNPESETLKSVIQPVQKKPSVDDTRAQTIRNEAGNLELRMNDNETLQKSDSLVNTSKLILEDTWESKQAGKLKIMSDDRLLSSQEIGGPLVGIQDRKYPYKEEVRKKLIQPETEAVLLTKNELSPKKRISLETTERSPEKRRSLETTERFTKVIEGDVSKDDRGPVNSEFIPDKQNLPQKQHLSSIAKPESEVLTKEQGILKLIEADPEPVNKLQSKERTSSKTEQTLSQPKEEEEHKNIDVLPGKMRLFTNEKNEEMPQKTENSMEQRNEIKPEKSIDRIRWQKRDDTHKAEICEECGLCSYNKECESWVGEKNKIDTTTTKTNGNGTKVHTMKSDQHNSLQIPGPIPSENSNNKEWKKNIARPSSLDKKKDAQKNKDKVKDIKQRRESLKKENGKNEDTTVKQKNTSSYTGDGSLPDVPIARNEELYDLKQNQRHSISKDSIDLHHNRLSKIAVETQEKRLSSNPRMAVIKDSLDNPIQDSMQNFYPQSERMLPTLEAEQRDAGIQVQQKSNLEEMIDRPPQSSQAANNSEGIRAVSPCNKRDVSVYRRSSGTNCFRTLPPDEPRCCRCPAQQGGHFANTGVQVPPLDLLNQEERQPEQGRLEQRRECFVPEPTYKVSSKQTRGTSPDNTDYEMSHMSDLPLEREDRAQRESSIENSGMVRPLSPGEDKTTSTYTETQYSTPTNYSLSEGEVPTSQRRTSGDYIKENQISTAPPTKSASMQRMEVALQAVTEELMRCKALLQAQRPTESQLESERSAQTSERDVSRSIPLRRGVATPRIGDAYTPKCVFTLHIGTVVLSDEAVASSRDKLLVLMWKFYDHSITMTRMRAGRVVLFDFSTEYDIKMTDEFLEYMKHEEMVILICEIDKEDEPFASCSLPLRDALLHTNRRADMSLALVGAGGVGASVGIGSALGPLDARDEMGVIDLWCMLRADARVLPGINRAIAQSQLPVTRPSTQQLHSNSRVMQQIIDEDHSDLEFSLQKPLPRFSGNKTTLLSDATAFKDLDFQRMSRRSWPKTNDAAPQMLQTNAQTQTPTSNKAETSFDLSKYPPIHRSSDISTPRTFPSQTKSEIIQEDPEHDSGIIINEVEPKIKSPDDMRQALVKSCYNKEFTRVPEEDQVSSLAQSSMSSVKSTLARFHRRGSPRSIRQDSVSRAMIQNLRRISKGGAETQAKIKDRDEPTDTEIYRKYENISKLIGTNKGDSSKKTVTIVPKYIESVVDVPQRDSPENQSSEEGILPSLDITVLWLALNEECEAMVNPYVQRVYVAYTFLGRSGADLETPVSLPKPKHYVDKCYFNFKKTFELDDSDLPKLGHMARCRSGSGVAEVATDCIIFSVVSEPPEDPLGLESCEDIGYAYLYLGDLVAYSAGSSGYTEVIPVRAARGAPAVCGVLAVRIDGLDVVRHCLLIPER